MHGGLQKRLKQTLQRGAIDSGIVILAFLAIVIFLFIIPHKGIQTTQSNTSLFGPQTSTGSAAAPDNKPLSSGYSRTITLNTGNASYATQSYEEYITLYNNGNIPVDISGWILENGRGNRAYVVGGTTEHFASERVVIPQAHLLPTGGPAQDVILAPGESAFVTTGSISNNYPYTIQSFKENACSSYLTDQNTYGYSFNNLSSSCVYPGSEPGVSGLDVQCQTFINGLQSCQQPKFNGTDYQGNSCQGCVNGTAGLSNACVAFIQSHYSYQGCLAAHQNDPNFYGTTWHIYLNHGLELWAKDHETISLYDASGKLVDYKTY